MFFKASLKKVRDLAVKMEEIGELFYRQLAEKSDDKKIKDICIFLANEERCHQKTFRLIMRDDRIDPADQEFNIDILTLMKDAIAQMKETGFETPSNFLKEDLSVTGCLRIALQVENETTLLYQEIQGAIQGGAQVALHRIIREEQKHATMIQNVLDALEGKKKSQPIVSRGQKESEQIDVEKIDKRIVVEQKIVKRKVKHENYQDTLYVLMLVLIFILIILSAVGPKLLQGVIDALVVSPS